MSQIENSTIRKIHENITVFVTLASNRILLHWKSTNPQWICKIRENKMLKEQILLPLESCSDRFRETQNPNPTPDTFPVTHNLEAHNTVFRLIY